MANNRVRRGALGEKTAARLLEDIPHTHLLKDIYVPARPGHTQIDLILLTLCGALVIECKNYSGIIVGSNQRYEWTQTLKIRSKSKTRNKFYNPIKQNQTHVDALASFLGINKSKIHSLIVFSDRCTLKKIPPNTEFCTITQMSNLQTAVADFLYWQKEVFTAAQLKALQSRLNSLPSKNVAATKAHQEKVRFAQYKRARLRKHRAEKSTKR